MLSRLGRQTVGIVTVTQTGDAGYLGVKAKARSMILRHNVHFRPVNTSETDEQTNVATETWKLTDRPEIAVLAAKSTGEIVYDGTDNPADVEANRFRIDGPIQPKHSLDGPHHVTIMCKRQVG